MATLLLVEDNPDKRAVLRKAFERTDHHVLDATDGRDAVDVFIRARVDLVIVDLAMAGREGPVAIARLRELRSPAPILALAGADEADQAHESRPASGADLRLATPFSTEELLAGIARLLHRGSEGSSTLAG